MAALLAAIEFRDGDRATLERLAAVMVRREYPAGSVLFSEGEVASTAFLVEAGRVWLTSVRADGAKFFMVDIGPGEAIGHFSSVLGWRRIGSASAHTDVVAWQIPRAELCEAVRADIGITYAMLLRAMEFTLERNVWAVETIGQSARGRVAWLLLSLIEGSDDSTIALSHADIAMRVGATRESVTRTLNSFKQSGVIRTRRRGIVVVDADELRRVAFSTR